MKKPRGDAKLKTLPPKLQAELFALLQQHGYPEVKAMIAKEPGILTSTRALSEFYAWYPLSRHLEQATSFANDLKAQLANLPEWQGKAAELEKLAQIAFETSAVQNQDADLYIALKKRRQKDADLALHASRHALALKQYEEKISAAKSSLEKAKSKGGLSKETLALIEEQLKLL
jgi:ATP phosphoribosyltransferase regulatory subunit HisZ